MTRHEKHSCLQKLHSSFNTLKNVSNSVKWNGIWRPLGLFLLCQAVEFCQLCMPAEFESYKKSAPVARSTVNDRPTSAICQSQSERKMLPLVEFITKSIGRKTDSRRYSFTQTAVSAQVDSLEERQLLTVDADGWTVLNPSSDSRMIYVSSSTGNDANNGLSEGRPKKTIDNARQLIRHGYPDWILLKSGDTFSEGTIGLGKSGRSVDEPIVFTSYGSGPMPILSETMFLYNGPATPGYALKYVAIRNLDLRGKYATRPTAEGNTFGILFLEETQHIIIEGNSFSGFYDGVNFQQSPGRNAPNGNLTFRRNVVANNTHQGMLLTHSDGVLFEQNIFDHNGYGSNGTSPSILTHNVYFKEVQDLTVRSNIFARGSNFGTKLSSDTPGGFDNFVVEDNLFFDNGLSLDHSAGSSGNINTTFTHEHGVIQNNIFTELNRSGGVQQDLAAYLLNSKDVLWSNNMFVHKQTILGSPILVWGEHHQDITVQGTVIYDWKTNFTTSASYLESDASRITRYTRADNEIDLPAASYVDPSRTVGSYYVSVGGGNDPVAFLTAAKTLSKANWNTALTADAVNDYIRGGFARVLATPVFTTPANTTTPDPLQTVSWNTIDGADSYEVWYANLTTGQNPFFKAPAASSSYTPATPLPIGTYQIWVRATQVNGPASPWSSPISLRVNAPPVLNSLSANAASARPQLTWSALPGAVTYEVNARNMTTGASNVVNARNLTETTFTPESDLGFGQYRFWVRGFDAKGVFTPWSVPQDYSRRDVTTSVQPVVFDGMNSLPPIAWDAATGAARYELWASNVTTGANGIVRNAQISGTSFVPNEPLPFGKNRFWVRPIDGDGTPGKWSQPLDAINVPTLLSPVLPTFERRPTFTWVALPGVGSSELYISVNGTVLNPQGLSGNTWTPDSDLPIGALKWWVRLCGANGVCGPWSLRGETFIGGRSAVLSAGVPGNDPGRIGVFSWQAVTGASRYILHVEQVGVGVAILEQNLTSTSYTTAVPMAAGQYRAWVKSIDSRDNVSGGWSIRAFEFTVVGIQPKNGDSTAAPQIAASQLNSVLANDCVTTSIPPAKFAGPVASHRTIEPGEMPSERASNSGWSLEIDAIEDWIHPEMSRDARMTEQDADLIDMLMANPGGVFESLCRST